VTDDTTGDEAEIADEEALETISAGTEAGQEESNDIASDDVEVPYEEGDEVSDDQPDSPLLTDEEKELLSQPISPLEPGE